MKFIISLICKDVKHIVNTYITYWETLLLILQTYNHTLILLLLAYLLVIEPLLLTFELLSLTLTNGSYCFSNKHRTIFQPQRMSCASCDNIQYLRASPTLLYFLLQTSLWSKIFSNPTPFLTPKWSNG